MAVIQLGYPDASGRFFGYTTNYNGAADGREGSAKDLVRATSGATTALIGQQSGNYVTSRSHLLSLATHNNRHSE